MAILPKMKIFLPEHISMLIHGPSDSGKTIFASCSPDLQPSEPVVLPRTFFMDVEGGMISQYSSGIIVTRYPEDPLKKIETAADLDKALQFLARNRNDFDYAALDSLDRFQESFLANMVKEKGHARPEMQDWGDLLYKLQRIGNAIPNLGVHTIVTCHTAEDKDENDHIVKYMPNIQGSFQSRLQSYFDVVGYYVLENGKRKLYTKPAKKYVARNRLNDCIPEVMEDPTVPQIVAYYLERREELVKQLSAMKGVEIVTKRESESK